MIKTNPSESGAPVQGLPLASQCFILLLTAYPIIWILGLGGAFWILLLPVSFAILLARRLKTLEWLLVIVGLLVLVSIPIGVARFGLDYSRVLGAVANGAVWFGAAAATYIMRNPRAREKALSRLIWIGGIQGSFTAAAALLVPTSIPLPVLSQTTLTLPSGLQAFADDRLFYMDWLGEAAYRSAGMMGNPTWAGAFAVLCIFVCCDRIRRRINVKFHFLILPLLGVSIYYALSRSANITLVLSVVAAWVLVKTLQKRLSLIPLLSLLVTLFALILVVNRSIVSETFSEVNSEREGSLESRSEIYEQTLQYISELVIPIVGYGVKPQIDGLVASIATHSTYLGLLFRGGAFAAIIFIVILIVAGIGVARANLLWETASVLFILIWCILEDFDGGHLLPLFLAASIGIWFNQEYERMQVDALARKKQ